MNLEVELTPEEDALIVDPNDKPIIRFINGLDPEEMDILFEHIWCTEEYNSHYYDLERDWINKEEYLIRNRPGHSNIVTDEEILEDLEKWRNPKRFRIFYGIKFRKNIYYSAGCLELIFKYLPKN